MKGISHFTSAIAAATFIPGVVPAAQNEKSTLLKSARLPLPFVAPYATV